MKKFGILLLLLTAAFNYTAMTQTNNTPAKQVHFVIHTDYGDMKGVLYNETPKHRDNFVKLAKSGFYDGLLFHRVIQGFMIQGGDPQSKNAKPGQQLGNGGPNYTIDAEFNPSLIHKKGALAAARTPDQVNPKKASSGSQFYIVEGRKTSAAQLESQYPGKYNDAQKKIYETLGGTPFLDGSYTVYGEITDGLDVIDKIAAVQKDANDRPVKDIKMTIKIIE
ncbi:MAG TPA: peptidylprolyl isomerase [Bacteroidales bacterium]|nr:peptidylprolyl isomerase [Bacteroidales bacterium]